MKRFVVILLLLLVAGLAVVAYEYYKEPAAPEGFASGNGRIEATEIDIATKVPGRIEEIVVQEGDFVTSGQVIGYMDTDQLKAQQREAQAQLEQAKIQVETSKIVVKQREAEKAAAESLVKQQQATLDGQRLKLERTEKLGSTQNVPREEVDDQRARTLEVVAAVSAAKAQVAASEAAISSSKSQVIAAEAAVIAAQARSERIDADLEDSILRAPRDGRVQYRVAEPGEVLSAGGNVVNLVDLGDVYMTFFLPTEHAGRVAIGDDVRIILDAAPEYVVPAKATFVADVAQFTPKTVETEEERQKLMFRVKARISPELLKKYIRYVKTGLPGVAYVRVDKNAQWPENLEVSIE